MAGAGASGVVDALAVGVGAGGGAGGVAVVAVCGAGVQRHGVRAVRLSSSRSWRCEAGKTACVRISVSRERMLPVAAVVVVLGVAGAGVDGLGADGVALAGVSLGAGPAGAGDGAGTGTFGPLVGGCGVGCGIVAAVVACAFGFAARACFACLAVETCVRRVTSEGRSRSDRGSVAFGAVVRT